MRYQAITESTKDIKNLVNENFDEFLKILLPFAPVLFLYEIRTVLISNDQAMFFAMPLFLLYIYALSLLSFSWMKVILLGKEQRKPINPFAPGKDALVFYLIVLGFNALLSFFPTILKMTLYTSNSIALAMAGHVISAVTYVACVYLIVRLCFLLPSKILGEKVNLQTSFELSHNCEDKIVLSGILAALPYIAIMLFAMQAMPFVGNLIIGEYTGTILQQIVKHVLYAPFTVFLEPLIFTIGSTAIAYHFAKTLQNRHFE